VAQGKDDVVEHALTWIKTLSYAYNVQVIRRGADTLNMTARVENPLTHTLNVQITLTNGSGGLIDSIALVDDGLHGDGTAGDGVWGCRYVPLKDDTLVVSIRTKDVTAGSSRTLPAAVRYLFTRKALITVDTRTVNLGTLHDYMVQRDTSFIVRNVGYMSDSLSVTLDPVNVSPDSAISVRPLAFALAAGDSQRVTFSVRPKPLAPFYYNAQVIIDSRFAFGQKTFGKVIAFLMATGVTDKEGAPKEYALSQNFPNPFNPSTTIHYDLLRGSNVRVTVYNTLGQRMAILVNEDQDPGSHDIRFDGSRLASGMYFYRLQAGDFVASKKMLLLK
jgi:hypothetical protein